MAGLGHQLVVQVRCEMHRVQVGALGPQYPVPAAVHLQGGDALSGSRSAVPNRRPSIRGVDRTAQRSASAAQCAANGMRMTDLYSSTTSSGSGVAAPSARMRSTRSPRMSARSGSVGTCRYASSRRAAVVKAARLLRRVRAGCGLDSAATAVVVPGYRAATAQASVPPVPCPTTTAVSRPSDRTTPAASDARAGTA